MCKLHVRTETLLNKATYTQSSGEERDEPLGASPRFSASTTVTPKAAPNLGKRTLGINGQNTPEGEPRKGAGRKLNPELPFYTHRQDRTQGVNQANALPKRAAGSCP